MHFILSLNIVSFMPEDRQFDRHMQHVLTALNTVFVADGYTSISS
jgi:hypothetical protein